MHRIREPTPYIPWGTSYERVDASVSDEQVGAYLHAVPCGSRSVGPAKSWPWQGKGPVMSAESALIMLSSEFEWLAGR